MPNLKISNHAQRVMRYKLLIMGQGHWIKESDGHYKHYTEEEYQKSPHGLAERVHNFIIGIGFIIVAIGVVISIIVGIVQWFIGLF